MRRAHRTDRRGGFTLIELIVVILIILILMGLVTAGVLKYMALGPQLQTTNEIRQLQTALETFKTKYKVYPPSRILLSNNPADYSTAFGQYSLQYLLQIWPRMQIGSAGFDWSGGRGGIPAGGVALEGDQALVYFLSGPGVGMFGGTAQVGTGWSTNPTNPTAAGGTRFGPFFDFNANQLVAINHNSSNPQQAAGFVSYKDAYATPLKFGVYAFFSSGRSPNGYNQGAAILGQASDCPSIGAFAYFQTTTQGNQFYNSSTVQIVSAGNDFTFGNPTSVPPGNGSFALGSYPVGNPGFDDLSNFATGFLGVANQ